MAIFVPLVRGNFWTGETRLSLTHVPPQGNTRHENELVHENAFQPLHSFILLLVVVVPLMRDLSIKGIGQERRVFFWPLVAIHSQSSQRVCVHVCIVYV